MVMTVPFWTRAGTIDLANLQRQDLAAETIADTLAKLNRFGGRTVEPWSVAAHSVLVERLLPPQLGPWALLHDAHEAFIGDIATPVVELIAQTAGLGHFDEALGLIKGRVDRAIGAAWNVAVQSMSLRLRKADRIALVAETILLVGVEPDLVEPADAGEIDRAIQILREMPMGRDWRSARDLWLSRVHHYAALGGMTPPTSKTPARPGGAT